MLDYTKYGYAYDEFSKQRISEEAVKNSDPDKICWNFGWVPPDERNDEQNAAHAEAIREMPAFYIQGRDIGADEKAFLWETWKHPKNLEANGGKVYSGTHQLTGSCVGAGGGNTIYTLCAIEVARLNEPEIAIVPFWLLPYGRSRYYAGMRGRGEGSLGSSFAKAAKVDGVIPANLDGLPKYTDNDGLVWGSSVEYQWSDGGAIDGKWLELSKKHLTRTVAPVNSADAARDALRNWYPVSFCGSWGGLMQCPVSEGVLLNRRSGTWNHQQSCHGWWDHPVHGEIFYILNQWGLRAHGSCPTGAPAGGYWIKKADMDWQCRNGECFAWSGQNGFPSQRLDYYWCN